MNRDGDSGDFSEDYGQLRALLAGAREDAAACREHVVQCIWYDRLFVHEGLCTDTGRPLSVLAPGWWNHSEGPDFRGAHIEIAGKHLMGDIEIHMGHGDWRQHGHHRDSRYDDVILVAVAESKPPASPPRTSLGRRIPTLLLLQFLTDDLGAIAERLPVEDYPYAVPSASGQCAALAAAGGERRLIELLELAGEWRMLNKARLLR